ncbi:MAG: 23S rRNA pseudouridine(1911/1915/1917) synthase RluD [Pseudomonadota bacterium]
MVRAIDGAILNNSSRVATVVRQIDETQIVPLGLAGERLDKVAAHLFTDYSRATLSEWITSGCLRVDGAVHKPRRRMLGGEALHLHTTIVPRERWQAPQAVDFAVLHEDEHLLVIDKPAGVVVHPGAGNPDGTLVNGLLAYREDLALLPRAGIVHRLDKDTSGVMVVAAQPAVHQRLVEMIAAREVQRVYCAVAEGRMVAGRNVDAPIGRHPQVRTRQAVREDGKPAYTEFRVLERYERHTLLEAVLGSGRTHQIRVHAQSIGHPLLGDRLYGARGLQPSGAGQAARSVLQGFKRQALHAWQLAFEHPVSGADLHLVADLPADLQTLIETLREVEGG